LVDEQLHFAGNPCFAYTDPNNLHLAYNSPCKDMGNPVHTFEDVGLYDIDGEERIVDVRVDIGADEIDSCDDDLSEDDIYHPRDWNADGSVNMEEFLNFSGAWLSCEPNFPGDPNHWNPVCNLDKTGDSEHKIDLADLEIFISETPWLWTACWKQAQMNRSETIYYSMMSGSESMMSVSLESSAVFYESSETEIQAVKISELNSMEKSIVQILALAKKETLKGQECPYLEEWAEIEAFLEDCLVDIRDRK